jgi:glucose-1-phosphate cytidylyltransferase
MKVVILAGGYGTRLAEYTNTIPKPMVKIGGEPILTHIMKIYKSFGIDDFIIAAGYKKEVIIDYYKNSKEFKNLKIIDTGKDTMTGGRLLRLLKAIALYLKGNQWKNLQKRKTLWRLNMKAFGNVWTV